jgi:hypothetical protein
MKRRIRRTSKFVVAQLVDQADRRTASELLQHMPEAVPHQDIILTDNGIGHRLTKPNHP